MDHKQYQMGLFEMVNNIPTEKKNDITKKNNLFVFKYVNYFLFSTIFTNGLIIILVYVVV